MKIILQIGIVLGICFVGEGVSQIFPFPFPASVISMILLFALLCTGALKQSHIKEKSEFLLKNMAFFFVPAGVGILAHYDSFKGQILPLAAVCVLTTIITFAASAYAVRGVIWLQNKYTKKGGE